MRKLTLIVLVVLSSLAAMFYGALNAEATHGNASYGCWNGKPVLDVTILGSTVWEGFNTATYEIKDHPELPPVAVQRDANGIMPDFVMRINEGEVILGSYDGPNAHSRNVPVPYTVSGGVPECTEETTTTVGETTTTVTGQTTTTVTGETATTVVGQTTTTSEAHSENLPATGKCVGWIILAGIVALFLGCAIGAYYKWNPRQGS